MTRPAVDRSGAYLVAAILAIVAFLAAVALHHRDDIGTTPTPTTYTVGPDGDNVVITPRAAP